MKQDEADVPGLLIKHELAIKQLYEIFATSFTNHEDFWRNLAADEQRHANWLEALRSKSAPGQWSLYGSQVKPQAIKTSIGYVESQITRARQGNMSLLQALSVARDLESALLERQFSRFKDSAPKELGAVLVILAAETEKHLRIVVEVMNSLKR